MEFVGSWALFNLLQNLNPANNRRFITAEKDAPQHLCQTQSGALHLIAAGLISQLSDHFTIHSRPACPQWMAQRKQSAAGIDRKFPI